MPSVTATSLIFLALCATAFAQISERPVNFRSTSAILNRPTVSPYLALADVTGSGADNSQNYFTSVQPRLRGIATDQRMQQAMFQTQRTASSLRSAAARQAQNPPRTTGHPSRFGAYLQYYPGLGR
jgi:hypothetical protein